MKNNLKMIMQKVTRKSFMSFKLYSFGSILLLLSSERNDNYLNIELSFAIFLFILVLCAAIYAISRLSVKQKSTNSTETEKSN